MDGNRKWSCLATVLFSFLFDNKWPNGTIHLPKTMNVIDVCTFQFVVCSYFNGLWNLKKKCCRVQLNQDFLKHWNFAGLFFSLAPLRIDHIQNEKFKKYEIRFTGKTTLIRRDFQTLNAQAARAALSSNVYQFCNPKSRCFMRDTDFVFPEIFDVVWEVYSLSKLFSIHCDKLYLI